MVGWLGEGETCAVYEAWDPAGNRRAVRIFKPERAGTRTLVANLGALSKELVACRLPGIAAHHGVGRLDDGRPYAASDCVDGEPLSAWLRRAAPVPVADLLAVTASLCRVLHSVHARGLAHGALTAAKVFRASTGPSPEVTVIGLGLSRAHLARPSNRAPPSPRDDLRAVGVWLEGALQGRAVPPPLSALIESLVSDAASGPASAADAALALSSLIAAPGEPAAAPPSPNGVGGVFHTTAEILAQQGGPAPAKPKALEPPRGLDPAEEPPARVPRGRILGGAIAAVLVAALGGWVWWSSQGPVEAKAPVAPEPTAARPIPAAPPPPVAEARPVPSARALVARATALTSELKRHPQTTYDARTALRALLKRCQANPDAAARAALAEELELWQRTYLPQLR